MNTRTVSSSPRFIFNGLCFAKKILFIFSGPLQQDNYWSGRENSMKAKNFALKTPEAKCIWRHMCPRCIPSKIYKRCSRFSSLKIIIMPRAVAPCTPPLKASPPKDFAALDLNAFGVNKAKRQNGFEPWF